MAETQHPMYSRAAQIMRVRGLKEENLQTEGMTLLYSIMGQKMKIAWMITDEALGTMTRDDVEHYTERIYNMLKGQPCTTTELLMVFFTKNAEAARSIGEGMTYWIVDETHKEVLVDDGQPAEFLGLHGVLANICRVSNEFRSTDTRTVIKEEKPVYIASKKSASSLRVKYFGVPFVTILLILANVITFFCTYYSEDFVLYLYKGCMNWELMTENKQYYRFITSMFLHGDVSHLVGNMFCLALYGWRLEKIYGHVRFTFCYFLTGLFAGLASALLHFSDGHFLFSIGASGAIFGIGGALVVMLIADPEERKGENIWRSFIYYMFPWYGIMQEGGRRIILRTMGIVILIRNVIEAADISSGIDNYAHMGGLLSGLIFALVVCVLWFRNTDHDQYA